jgi:hypothetical protein
MTDEEKDALHDRYFSDEVRDLREKFFTEFNKLDLRVDDEKSIGIDRLMESGFAQFILDFKDVDPVLIFMVMEGMQPSFQGAYIKRVILDPRLEAMGFDEMHLLGSNPEQYGLY